VSGNQSLDEFIGGSEHDSSAQFFLVFKNSLHLVDSLFDVGEVPRSHFELVELLDCRRVCGTGQSFGEIVGAFLLFPAIPDTILGWCAFSLP
jgi:hypothetical protein